MATDDNIDTHKRMEMDDNVDNHQQMAMEDGIDTQTAKRIKLQEEIPKPHDAASKMKLEEENIPKSPNAANKIKLEDDIPKCQDGTNTANSGDPERVLYAIFLIPKVIKLHVASGGDYITLFRKVMKDAGCSESLIDELYSGATFFGAKLNADEVKRLSDLDCVRGVKHDTLQYFVPERFVQ